LKFILMELTGMKICLFYYTSKLLEYRHFVSFTLLILDSILEPCREADALSNNSFLLDDC